MQNACDRFKSLTLVACSIRGICIRDSLDPRSKIIQPAAGGNSVLLTCDCLGAADSFSRLSQRILRGWLVLSSNFWFSNLASRFSQPDSLRRNTRAHERTAILSIPLSSSSSSIFLLHHPFVLDTPHRHFFRRTPHIAYRQDGSISDQHGALPRLRPLLRRYGKSSIGEAGGLLRSEWSGSVRILDHDAAKSAAPDHRILRSRKQATQRPAGERLLDPFASTASTACQKTTCSAFSASAY